MERVGRETGALLTRQENLRQLASPEVFTATAQRIDLCVKHLF